MRVYCKDEALAKILKHPISKVGFHDVNTPANWPDDSFTHRRIRDGDVTLEEPKGKAEEKPKAEAKPPAKE